MDIDRIRYFSVLAELKHVRKAAELLKINPASLSRAIKVLESEVGFKLLVPDGRGIEITDKGMSFSRQSRGLLQEYLNLKSSLKEGDVKHPRVVRLGSMEVFTTYFLSKFIETAPDMQRLSTRYLTPGKMEEALKHREIDIGITYVQLPEDELRYLKVGEFQMRLFGARSMLEKKFADLPFAVPIDGVHAPGVALRSLDGWPSDQFPRRIEYEFELLETALQICRLGRAVLYCPDFVVRLHNECVQSSYRLKEFPLPAKFKEKKLSIYLVSRKNEEESPFIRKLAKLARSFSR